MSEHDPGGANQFPLLPGWRGSAVFLGDREEHRLVLERWHIDVDEHHPFALVIGMNPSTARGGVDDLTIRKDLGFIMQPRTVPPAPNGFRRMVKCNIASFRSTDPEGMAAFGVNPVHPQNLTFIRDYASQAAFILVATGAVPKILFSHARRTFKALAADGRTMWCLGRTGDGWPRHTSRLPYSTPLEEFRP